MDLLLTGSLAATSCLLSALSPGTIELEPVSHCFGKIKFMSAALSEVEDRYPQGPSNMFFKLFTFQK